MVYFLILGIACILPYFQVSSLRVTVFGANGRTGSKCVETALKKGFDVNAVTRTGVLSAEGKKTLIPADVTKEVTINYAVKGSDSVIFASSASKEGGSPQEVDRDGLINVAKVCIENKVPRLVIVSSGAVTKPFSPVYLFLNLFGGIMKAKIEGENAVRQMYEECGDDSLGYTVIRPGGLTEEPGAGCNMIELNQGDDRSGRISRWDVAALCIECIEQPAAFRTTVEAYTRGTGQPLSNVGFSNLLKLTNPDGDGIPKTGFERVGSTFTELFSGLSKD